MFNFKPSKSNSDKIMTVQSCIQLHNWASKSDVWMEQHALKSVGNYLNTNIYSYFETSGGQSSNLNLNDAYFFNARVN